ncbi:MAG TPA: hypothetical protein VFX60_02340 [Micromonospora sp.]|nr:hypothetical protein [Micromonospora sp.]
MSQPEESRPKTPTTDDVLLRPGRHPDRRVDQLAPRPPERRGKVRVEEGGELRPLGPTGQPE